MSLIRSADAAVYYEECGTGQPLVLLPGLLGTIESHWRRFIRELSEHYHVIAVDLRGHGRTNNPSGVLRLETLVNDLAALVDTLQLGKVRMCGYSLGGYIGLAYGLRHPGKVEALVMHATKFFWTRENAMDLAGTLEVSHIVDGSPGWAAALQLDHSPANGVDGWKTLAESARRFILTLPEEGIQLPAVALADFPVLVSLGDQDEMIPRAEAGRLSEALPDSRLVILENTRHPMQKVARDVFLGPVLPFLHQAASGIIPHQQREV